MSKVYLHDEATGVVVEDSAFADKDVFVRVPSNESHQCVHPTAAEFRAVIEGGLRWMLSEMVEPLPEEAETLRDAIAAVEAIRIVRDR